MSYVTNRQSEFKRQNLFVQFSPLQAAQAQGVKIHHLNIGDPDIHTPTVMIDALKNWNAPVIKYAPSQGFTFIFLHM